MAVLVCEKIRNERVLTCENQWQNVNMCVANGRLLASEKIMNGSVSMQEDKEWQC